MNNLEIPSEYVHRAFLNGHTRKNYRHIDPCPGHVLGNYTPYVPEPVERTPVTFELLLELFREYWLQSCKRRRFPNRTYFANGKSYTSRLIIAPENISKIHEVIKYWSNDPTGKLDPKKGLWIFGTYGCGKTEFMNTLISFVNSYDGGIKTVNYDTIFDDVRNAKDVTPVHRHINHLCYIDDIAYQNRHAVKLYGNNDNVIDLIITRCYEFVNRGRYFVTSNYTPGELLELQMIHPGTYDRIRQLFNVIEWKGESLR